jgi:trk system potassium uptake protein TrkA
VPERKPERDAGVLVIGLGRFGSAIGATLDRLGQDVLAVEQDPVLVAQWSGRLPLVEADASNPEALEQLGAKDFGVAVVGDLGQGDLRRARPDPDPHRRPPRRLP